MTRLLPRCRKVTMRPVRIIWCALFWENGRLEIIQEKTFTHVLRHFSPTGAGRAFFSRMLRHHFIFRCNGSQWRGARGILSGGGSSDWGESRDISLAWVFFIY